MNLERFESAVGVSLPVPALEELAEIIEGIDDQPDVNGVVGIIGDGKFELVFKGIHKEKVIELGNEYEQIITEAEYYTVEDGINVTPKDFGEMVEAIDVQVVVEFDGEEATE